jgi:hypothetical protein
LLDLHLALDTTRKVHHGHIVEFDGRNYEVSPTARKRVTPIFHPPRKLWVFGHASGEKLNFRHPGARPDRHLIRVPGRAAAQAL